MKNKKLFAILTLVCFMFTLMPVAAFAGDGDVVKVLVSGNEKNSATITAGDSATFKYYNAGVSDDANKGLFIVKEGKLYTTEASLTYTFAEAGTYEVYAADKDEIAGIVTEKIEKAKKLVLLKELDTATEKAVAVKVKEKTNIYYDIVISNNAAEGNATAPTVTPGGDVAVTGNVAEWNVTVNANGGWDDNGHFTAQLAKYEKSGSTYSFVEYVEDAELTFTEVGYAEVVLAEDAVTEFDGTVDFEVVGDRTGDYKVIVKYGNKAEATLNVNVQAQTVANVSLVAAPTAPVDVDNNIQFFDIEFKFVDANGNAYAMPTTAGVVNEGSAELVKVDVTSKPVDSTVDEDTFTLVKEGDDVDGVYTLAGTFDEEGKYTIKVTLKNGKSAEVTVEAAEQGEIVGIKYDVYNTPRTVAYGGQTLVDKVLAYDANGVVSAPSGVTFSANGIAINKFNRMVYDHNNDSDPTVVTPADVYEDVMPGGVMVLNDNDYIGSTITVMAEYDGFTTTTVLTVVDKPNGITFADATAEVGVAADVIGTVVDVDGKGSSIAGQTYTASTIVLDKPANAVAVANATVNTKGQVELNFLASEEGTYKVQVAVTYGTNNNFVSGVATIVVGEGEGTFEDVVVMSIGANNIVVNSDVKAIAAAPMIKDGRTFVPFRALAEAFGADVEWVEATQSVVAELNGVKVVMNIGENAYTVNGVAKTADVAPFINGASTMVPVRFVAEAFGINVTPIAAADGTIADVLFAK